MSQEDELLDTDGNPGHVSTMLSFGPNAMEGVVYEEGILSYVVFMIDECHLKIGEAVATIPVARDGNESLAPADCCQIDMYEVEVQLVLPPNATSVRFMVVPNTTAGLLTVGAVTPYVFDDDTGEPESAKRSRTSSSDAPRQPQALAARAAALAALWLAAIG